MFCSIENSCRHKQYRFTYQSKHLFRTTLEGIHELLFIFFAPDSRLKFHAASTGKGVCVTPCCGATAFLGEKHVVTERALCNTTLQRRWAKWGRKSGKLFPFAAWKTDSAGCSLCRHSIVDGMGLVLSRIVLCLHIWACKAFS